MKAVRFGILGAGWIVQRIMPSMKKAKNFVFVAIASRSASKARKAAKMYRIDGITGYRNLLVRDDIEAVYIALPESEHARWTELAARAGKHVVCEKTLSPDLAGAKQALTACRQNKVRLLEGFMYRFNPATADLKRKISKIKARMIRAHFSFFMTDFSGYRTHQRYGGGALNDLGCYCVNLARFLADRKPRVLEVHIRRRGRSVDMGGSIKLDFGDNLKAELSFGFDRAYAEHVEVFGSGRSIRLESPFTRNVQAHQLQFDAFAKALRRPGKEAFDFELEALHQARTLQSIRQKF